MKAAKKKKKYKKKDINSIARCLKRVKSRIQNKVEGNGSR